MINRGKQNLLGVCIDALDYDFAIEKIVESANAGRGMSVTALAVHGVMTGVQSTEHRYRLNHFDLVVPDGQPVRWGINALYKVGLKDRVYGPTLTLKLCERAERDQVPVYFYGSKPEVLEKMRTNLEQRFPNLIIAGMQASKFRTTSAEEKAEIAQQIRESGAKITFVGLGCPRQEVWAYEYKESLGMPILAVGAAFDFIAGTSSQAPAWMQKRGLEWLFRLVHEPRRLWQRYLILNPMYLTLLAMQYLKIRRFPTENMTSPQEEIRYG